MQNQHHAPRSDAETLTQGVAPDQYAMIRNIENLILHITRFLAPWVLVFAHHSFGSRYLTISSVLISFSFMHIWMQVAAFIHYAGHPLELVMGIPFYGLHREFVYAFFIASCLHLGMIWSKRLRKKEEGGHSRSSGVSILDAILVRIPLPRLPLIGQIEISEAFSYTVLEPVVCFLVVAYCTDGAAQTFLTVCCISAAIHSHLVYSHQRQRRLDQQDRQIEAGFYAQHSTHRNMRIHESAGYHVQILPPSRDVTPVALLPVSKTPVKGESS